MRKFPYRIVDLSHPINSSSACWDGGCGFKHSIYQDYNDTCDSVSFRSELLKAKAFELPVV